MFSRPDALGRVDEEVRRLMEPLLDMGKSGEMGGIGQMSKEEIMALLVEEAGA